MLAALESFARTLLSRSRVAGNVFMAHKVEGVNMEPAIRAGSRVHVDRQAYRASTIRRGDVVAYRSARHILVSRVVGLPEEVVELINTELHVDGKRIPEPYVDWERGLETDYSQHLAAVFVPDGCVYVLGDFRDMSKDSRMDGPVRISDVVGRVVRVKHGDLLRDIRRVG